MGVRVYIEGEARRAEKWRSMDSVRWEGSCEPPPQDVDKRTGGKGGSRPVDSAHQPGHACMRWISHAQGKGIETHAHTSGVVLS